MSHFYSSCQGGRGKATRCGHKSTGVNAMARCHELTIDVTAQHTTDGVDMFDIRVTVDSPHAVVRNSKNNQTARGNSFHPLRVIYDPSQETVTIQHTVERGSTHNVTAVQADFLEEGY